MQGHSKIDIRRTEISMYGYQSSIIHAFMDTPLDINGFLWIYMHGLAMDSRSRDGFHLHLSTFQGSSEALCKKPWNSGR